MKDFDEAARPPDTLWRNLANQVENTLEQAWRRRLIDGYRRADQADHVSLTLIGLDSARRRLPGKPLHSRADTGDFRIRVSDIRDIDFLLGTVSVDITPVGLDEYRLQLVEKVTPLGFTSMVQPTVQGFRSVTTLVTDLTEAAAPFCRREAATGGLPSPLLNHP